MNTADDFTIFDLVDTEAAERRIRGVVFETPVIYSPELSTSSGAEVYLKLESMQLSGSFKARGAANALLALSGEQRKRGIVTASTGNHGRALALLAKQLEVRCVVCMSALVPSRRADAVRAQGANVVLAGDSQDEAVEHALRLAADQGLHFVHPFDDLDVIAGQGTVGLELGVHVQSLDAVIVPTSGAGMLSGVGVAMRQSGYSTEVYGASSAACPAMAASLIAGHPVETPELPSIADNLGGGIGLRNRYTFRLARQVVSQMLVVTDDEVRDAMTLLFRSARVVAEGAGAAGVAALRQLRRGLAGQRVAVIVSGGNIAPEQWARAVGRGSDLQ